LARRKNNSVGVVIPAGGRGLRLGGGVPKQFLLLDGKPVLHHSIAAFESLKEVAEIVVAVPADELRRTEALVKKSRFKKVSHIVVGGKERQHSVRNGLLSFDCEPEIVLVHDAVRPLVTARVIREVIAQSLIYGAAVVGVPVKDTIKLAEKGFYRKTLDRRSLWAVQTPQGFHFGILMDAHFAAQRSAFVGTDDASLVERLQCPVKIVEGEYGNIKITTKEDLRVADVFLHQTIIGKRSLSL
jgi:2-C-methyl-D-erythritol 4-phosphate cytidylyltransferase